MLVLGGRNVIPITAHIRTIQKQYLALGPVADFRNLPDIFHTFSGMPHVVIGVVEVLMSIGLLMKSRFAWTVGIILSAASLSILVTQRDGRLGPATWLAAALLAGLFMFRSTFSRSSLATGTLYSVVSVAFLFGYGIFGTYLLGNGFAPPVKTLMTALYFSVVTMTTVGYGDILPKTDDARLFVVSLILLGITVFTTSVSAVIIPLANERVLRLITGEKRTMNRKNHYVLIGTGSLAHNAYQELVRRNLPVTMVVDHELTKPPWKEADQVVGDPVDTDTLKKAGAMDAAAVLSFLENDGENAFVVLALREMGSPAKTVVSIRDRVNIGRIRTVKPDMILSPDIIGSELLAMALAGEKIDAEAFMRKVFQIEPAEGSGNG
jgi:voltage-gated potassium channel